MSFFRRYWPYLCVFAALSALSATIFTPLTSHHPYPYDSADYVYAGKQGFWANYIDANAMAVPELVQKGLELTRHPEKRASFSQEIRASRDIGFYRHYHGPLLAYWIALLQSVGIDEEQAVRNSQFLILILTALAMMLAYWHLFPEWPPVAGLMAGGLLLFNRTALMTTAEVTQHIFFMLMATLTLWALAVFCRTLSERWWYLTMAGLALSLLAVESAFMVACTIFVVLLILWKPIAQKWPSPKTRIVLFLKGVGVFFATMFVLWPASLIKLGVARGYVYLAYIALQRKTFSSRGVVESWLLHFRVAPFEHALLVTGFLLSLILWYRFAYRREALPWIVYALVFIVVTTKVTVEYTHYRGTISIAFILATAMVAGYLWKEFPNLLVRGALVVAVAIGAGAEGYRRYETLVEIAEGAPPASAGVVDYARTAAVPPDSVVYVPYYFVPALHLYFPDLKTVGYDADWPVSRLVAELRQPNVASEFICPASQCRAVANILGLTSVTARPVAPEYNGQPLYAMQVPR